MSPNPGRKFFVNLSVKDLAKSKAFFERLGFTFNPKFTDEKAACMQINEEAFVMLLVEPFFKTFTEREPCDPRRQTEALLSVSCQSRGEVDRLVHEAVAAGGQAAMKPQDHGFMYDWSFYDPDGHGWGVFWMDPKAAAQ